MIKRPCLIMLVALILGELPGLKLNIQSILILNFILFILIFFFIIPIRNKNKTTYFIFVFFISLSSIRAYTFKLNLDRLAYIYEDNTYLKDYELKVKKITYNNLKLKISSPPMILTSNDMRVREGDIIRISGKLKTIKPPKNYAEFDARAYYRSKNIYYFLDVQKIKIIKKKKKLLPKLKERLEKNILHNLNKKEAGLVIAILLGDKGYLDENIYNLFKENGIAHILAISGLHISLIGMSIYYLLRKKLKISYFSSGILSYIILIFYQSLIGGGVSIFRAVNMLFILFIANYRGKSYDLLSTLSIVASFLILKNPYNLFEPSFVLSFMAVFSIGISKEYLSYIIKKIFLYNKFKKKWLENFVDNISILFGIQLINLPVIAYYFFYIPIYAIFLNILILPLMSILCCCSFLMLFPKAFIISDLSRSIIYFIINIYERLCLIFSSLPSYRVLVQRPSIFKFFLYYIFLFAPIIYIKLMIGKKPLNSIKNKIFHLLFFMTGLVLSLLILFFDFHKKDEIFFLSDKKANYTYMKIEGKNILISQKGFDNKYFTNNILEPFLLSRNAYALDFLFICDKNVESSNSIAELVKNKKIKVKNVILPINYKDNKRLADKISNINIIYLGKKEKFKIKLWELKFVLTDKKNIGFMLSKKALRLVLDTDKKEIRHRSRLRYIIYNNFDKNIYNKNIYNKNMQIFDLSKMALYLNVDKLSLEKIRSEDEEFTKRYKK